MLSELNSGKDKQLKLPYSDFALSLEYAGMSVDDAVNWYWCVSPIEDENGKVHLFCSRWPSKDGMAGWFTESEIVHFIGNTPTGPFEFQGTVLCNDNIPGKSWQSSPHNPQIFKIDDRYALIYIIQDNRVGGTMKTGLMLSYSLDGLWAFAGEDGIVVEQSNDEDHWTYKCLIGTENPTMAKIDDTYYIFFKSGKQQNEKIRYGYSTSKEIEGPYVMCDEPKMDNIHYVEDAVCFQQNDKVYLLTTDNFGANTGIFGAGILWEMNDGMFKLQDATIGFGVLSDYVDLPECTTYYDGERSGKLERPGILMQQGKPTYLYGSTRTNIKGSGKNGCYIFKVITAV